MYDAAWNLNWRTNDLSVYAFQVEVKNELTNFFFGTNVFHGNGNMTSGNDGHNSYVYDDENRLIQ